MTSMNPVRRLIVLSLLCIAAIPSVAQAGPMQQAVRREVLRRGEQAAATRLLGRAAQSQAARIEQQATRKVAMRRVLATDLKRDSATKAVPLPIERRVFRYTTAAQAKREAKKGIRAGMHMTARAHPGRPPLAAVARRQYGLPSSPQVRMTIKLNKGFPARHNKALAGAQGRGELTSPEGVPPINISRVVRLR